MVIKTEMYESLIKLKENFDTLIKIERSGILDYSTYNANRQDTLNWNDHIIRFLEPSEEN